MKYERIDNDTYSITMEAKDDRDTVWDNEDLIEIINTELGDDYQNLFGLTIGRDDDGYINSLTYHRMMYGNDAIKKLTPYIDASYDETSELCELLIRAYQSYSDYFDTEGLKDLIGKELGAQLFSYQSHYE